ncbi:MAG: hypothetical protein KKF80_07350 [Candidatus Omnitrophica bacterium]|nr:hypothetical protein [Candidatus Omnitrophota bacterium]
MLLKIQKAQSTLEYALLIGVVVGALLTMQNYLKRSVMGKVQSVADNIGDPYSPGHTFRNETMTANATQIVESTSKGANGTTITNVTGGAQWQKSVRELDNITAEEWAK